MILAQNRVDEGRLRRRRSCVIKRGNPFLVVGCPFSKIIAWISGLEVWNIRSSLEVEKLKARMYM